MLRAFTKATPVHAGPLSPNQITVMPKGECMVRSSHQFGLEHPPRNGMATQAVAIYDNRNVFMPKLVVIEGPARGAVYVLTESDVSIGRSSSNDIAIADLSLSRRHSAVRYADGSYKVRDLESNNGTFVNQVA